LIDLRKHNCITKTCASIRENENRRKSSAKSMTDVNDIDSHATFNFRSIKLLLFNM